MFKLKSLQCRKQSVPCNPKSLMREMLQILLGFFWEEPSFSSCKLDLLSWNLDQWEKKICKMYWWRILLKDALLRSYGGVGGSELDSEMWALMWIKALLEAIISLLLTSGTINNMPCGSLHLCLQVLLVLFLLDLFLKELILEYTFSLLFWWLVLFIHFQLLGAGEVDGCNKWVS